MKKIILKNDQEELVNQILTFALNKGLTISNVIECIDEVVGFMENNAVLGEPVQSDELTQ